MKCKRGFEINELGKILLAVLVLAIMVGFILLFKGKGSGILESIKNLMRFGH
ncbi:MAG: hypothetical protein ACOYT4_04345 [Nanoarchaeota archaeon]